MPKFHGNAAVYGGKYLGEVEADTPEEALDKLSGEAGTISLCHQCASECEDGTAEDITVTNEAGEVVIDEAADQRAEQRARDWKDGVFWALAMLEGHTASQVHDLAQAGPPPAAP